MSIEAQMTDKAILEEIGRRLGRRRVERDFTQAALAREAGISKRTLERLEAGEPIRMSAWVRVLRVLELLGSLDGAIPEAGHRPMSLLRSRGKERRRASSKRHGGEPGSRWSWDDET